MPMLLGYARVSRSDDQKTAPQLRLLKEAGCKKVFEEVASGGRWERPELCLRVERGWPGQPKAKLSPIFSLLLETGMSRQVSRKMATPQISHCCFTCL